MENELTKPLLLQDRDNGLDSEQDHDPKQNTNRWTLVICGLLCQASLAGVVVGYPGLKDVLVKENVYSWLCHKGEDIPCTSQLLRLDLMFTLATGLLNVFAAPVGIILDVAGPKKAAAIGRKLMRFRQ